MNIHARDHAHLHKFECTVVCEKNDEHLSKIDWEIMHRLVLSDLKDIQDMLSNEMCLR